MAKTPPLSFYFVCACLSPSVNRDVGREFESNPSVYFGMGTILLSWDSPLVEGISGWVAFLLTPSMAKWDPLEHSSISLS